MFHETETKPYSECLKKGYFTQCYWRTHPATAFSMEQDINQPKDKVDYKLDFNLN